MLVTVIVSLVVCATASSLIPTNGSVRVTFTFTASAVRKATAATILRILLNFVMTYLFYVLHGTVAWHQQAAVLFSFYRASAVSGRHTPLHPVAV